MKVVLVDDDPSAVALLRKLVSQLPEVEVVAEFDRVMRAYTFLQSNPVDLLLLDLGLPDGSGFSLLQRLEQPPAVILTTSSVSDALEAYNLGIIDYLVKPISPARFTEAIHRLWQRRARPTFPPTLMLKEGRGWLQVRISDIQFITAKGPCCLVQLTTHSYVVSHLLAELAQMLPEPDFIRVHRSYLVASAAISRLSLLSLQVGSQTIPVGLRYRARLKSIIGNH